MSGSSCTLRTVNTDHSFWSIQSLGVTEHRGPGLRPGSDHDAFGGRGKDLSALAHGPFDAIDREDLQRCQAAFREKGHRMEVGSAALRPVHGSPTDPVVRTCRGSHRIGQGELQVRTVPGELAAFASCVPDLLDQLTVLACWLGQRCLKQQLLDFGQPLLAFAIGPKAERGGPPVDRYESRPW